MYPRVAGGGSYIDGFAGTGTVHIKDNPTPRAGSVEVALRSKAFKQLFLYELPENAKHLEHWLRGRGPTMRRKCLVTPGDFNQTVLEHLDAGRIPRDKPCFAFLDPNSTELNWSTLERLATYKGDDRGDDKVLKVELFVLVNTHQALMRLMPTRPLPTYRESAEAATLDRVMGGRDAWWDLYEEGRTGGHWLRGTRSAWRRSSVTARHGHIESSILRQLDPSTTWSRRATMRLLSALCIGRSASPEPSAMGRRDSSADRVPCLVSTSSRNGSLRRAMCALRVRWIDA